VKLEIDKRLTHCIAILGRLVKKYGVHSFTVSDGSIRHGLADKATFMKISRASRSTAIGPGQPPIVSLPAIGALNPRVDILFWVGLRESEMYHSEETVQLT
jgi:hypothetical protein